MNRTTTCAARAAALTILAALVATSAGATPLPSTVNDFVLPGTQPSTITDPLLVPADCTACHTNYARPDVEPYRAWQGSMMAQAGRDPLMYAAMAISNQDAPSSGETCIRCHMPKGWLEGRSLPADASATTAADRQGVQCNACHRMVDPDNSPGAPAEDTAILAALTTPVTSTGGGQYVIDPVDHRRGPFDIVSDLGFDPHQVGDGTLVSPFHTDSQICGTCHNVLNPIYRRNMSGDYDVTAFDAPIDDPSLAFPEQQAYTEWANSTYASTGVYAPQFAGNGDVGGNDYVGSCQSCHMPSINGKDAITGLTRPDMPFHDLVGANTIVPAMIAMHPVFASETNADSLTRGIARADRNLKRAATVSGSIASGVLTVHVVNETGHKLPTSYPDGRRMWLHVIAYGADDAVVYESGDYDATTAQLAGYQALPMDADYDPDLHVWETIQGMSADVALAAGLVAGPSFHLSLNNVREFDNRIPPRGFTNAAFAAGGCEPVGASYADGQYWDDVTYPVGTGAVRAEVVLNYQATTKEYMEFLRDENMTNGDGTLAYNLWAAAGKGAPVEMAHLMVETNAKAVAKCRKNIDKTQARYLKAYLADWGDCYDASVSGDGCNAASAQLEINSDRSDLRERIGGAKDKKCEGAGLTPGSIGLGSYCPLPCQNILLFDMDDVADCAICLSDVVATTTLDSAYGVVPPTLPAVVTAGPDLDCQLAIADASRDLASAWTSALSKCEYANATGKNDPVVDCTTDPSGKIGKAQLAASEEVATCASFTGIEGCAETMTAPLTYQCIEDALGDVVLPYTGIAYP